MIRAVEAAAAVAGVAMPARAAIGVVVVDGVAAMRVPAEDAVDGVAETPHLAAAEADAGAAMRRLAADGAAVPVPGVHAADSAVAVGMRVPVASRGGFGGNAGPGGGRGGFGGGTPTPGGGAPPAGGDPRR